MSFEQLISNIKSYAKQVYNQDNNADKRELARVESKIKTILDKGNSIYFDQENHLNILLAEIGEDADIRTKQQLHKQYEKEGIPISVVNTMQSERQALLSKIGDLERELHHCQRTKNQQIRELKEKLDESEQFYEEIMDSIRDGTYKLTT